MPQAAPPHPMNPHDRSTPLPRSPRQGSVRPSPHRGRARRRDGRCGQGRQRGWLRFASPWVLALLWGLAGASPQELSLPSLSEPERPLGQAAPARQLLLRAHWWPAQAAGRHPAVLLLHGCGGAYDDAGRLSQRMRDYAGLLNAQGWHALVLDSLTTRGETELCTQKTGSRRITQTERRADALSGLQWLAARPDVDASRLALLGWSNGGSTVLAATNLEHPLVASSRPWPRAAVAFYPGCESELRRGYRPSTALLMLLGAADDWTPAAPCVALAGPAAASEPRGANVQLRLYEGAFHGFDGSAPLRLRRDVPNGVHPGAGVHVGGHPQARDAARRELLDFLRRAFAAEADAGRAP